MIIIEENQMVWVAESRAVPLDKTLWTRAKQIARLDKEYSQNAARIITKRIYAMMGGRWKRKAKK